MKYTNFILTIIAALLFILCLPVLSKFFSTANAQSKVSPAVQLVRIVGVGSENQPLPNYTKEGQTYYYVPVKNINK